MEEEKEIRGWVNIVVETDKDDPETIAIITMDNIDVIKGYRVRMKPVYED
nr:hypothetical protein [uncultured Lachnoanaerobaculum sp.]